jgi:hypothetical protein
MAVLVVYCGLGLASPADAVTLTQSSSLYLGSIVPNVPASPADEASYINALLDLAVSTTGTFSGQALSRSANTLCGSSCPDATALGSLVDITGNDINVGSGFTYLLAKYDASKGGGLVWYVAGLTGVIDVQPTFGSCGSGGCGLSHITAFNPGGTVPEPGTLLLLGGGLVALGIWRPNR